MLLISTSRDMYATLCPRAVISYSCCGWVDMSNNILKEGVFLLLTAISAYILSVYAVPHFSGSTGGGIGILVWILIVTIIGAL